MSAEDLGILHDLQTVTGIRSQSEVIRMALRALAKNLGVDAKATRATGDPVRSSKPRK